VVGKTWKDVILGWLEKEGEVNGVNDGREESCEG